ncbi:MAG: hypothetical protein M3457_07745, partial [Chloroflexota bacterium]|nr:hypothetical protein [Chloroflexota bacterium]
MHGVDPGRLGWVDPGGWGEPGPAVVDGDGPVACFDFVVVKEAEQYAVVLVGLAAVQPGEDVVGWVQDTGRSQPGQAQPRSRTSRAVRIGPVNSRRVRPTSSGFPSMSTVTGTRSASQASSRASV